MQIQFMFIIAFQQESQSHYTVRYLTSTRPNPEHKSVMSCGSIYFNVIGSKRLSTAVTIASDEIRPGKHGPEVGIEIFVFGHFTDRTLTKCTLAYA